MRAKKPKRIKKIEAEERVAAKIVREGRKKENAPPARPSSIISCEDGFCQELISRRKIAQIILFIYQQHDYERQCEIPLENYTVPELNLHLERLVSGYYPWITK